MLRKFLLLLSLIPALLQAQEWLASSFPLNATGEFTGVCVFDDGRVVATAKNTVWLFNGTVWKPLIELDSGHIQAITNVNNKLIFATESDIYEVDSHGYILKKVPIITDVSITRLWYAIPLKNGVIFTGTSTAYWYSFDNHQEILHFPGEGRVVICKNTEESVYFSRKDGGIFLWHPNQGQQKILTPEQFSGVLVGLHEWHERRIVVTANGILTWRDEADFSPAFKNAEDILSGTGVISSYVKGDKLWVLTYREGLLSFDSDGAVTRASISTADRTPNPTAWAPDAGNSIWWAASGVVSQLWADNPARIWTHADGLVKSRIHRMALLKNQPAALSANGLFSFTDNHWQMLIDTYSVSAGSNKTHAWSGSQWGLYWKPINDTEWQQLVGPPVYSVLPGTHSWLLGRPGEIVEWVPGGSPPSVRWQLANFIPAELSSIGDTVFAVDDTGMIIALNEDGTSSAVSQFASGRELPLFHWQNELYLGGDEDVFRWNDGQWEKSGWGHTFLRTADDAQGTLYVLARINGLVRLGKITGDTTTITIIPFDGEAQLANATDLLYANGKLYISTLAGVLEIDPAAITPIPPGKTIVSGDDTVSEYPFDDRSFRWQLGASRLHQGVTPEYTVQIILNGNTIQKNTVSLDWSWTAPGHGNYHLIFQAVDPYWGPLAPIERYFVIAKPWWRTWPAIAGFIITFALFIWAINRISVIYYTQKNLRLQNLIDRRTAELKEANQARNRFLARVSHEIRNPLNGISGLIPVVKDGPLTERQHEAVSGLEACSRTLTSLLRDVLDLARLEAGKETIHVDVVNLIEVLDDFSRTCRIAAEEKQILFQLIRDDNLPRTIRTDGGRLRQIIQNLTGNAIKFTPSGGSICLKFEFFVLHENTGDFVVTVEDTGPGFPGEVLEKQELFLTGPSRPGQTGSGVGLALAIDLAKRLGGKITIENNPSGGARVCLRLLVNTTMNQTEPQLDTPLLPKATGQSILVVEDQHWNRVAIDRVLTTQGYSTVMATTVAEGMQLLESNKVDAVLSDWDLPDGDGLSYCREVLKRQPHLPVFLVTAFDNPVVELKILAAGLNGLIPKPIDDQKLLQTLGDAIKLAAEPPRISALASLMKETEKAKIRAELADLRAKLEAAVEAEDWDKAATYAHQSANDAALVGEMALQLRLHTLEQKIRRIKQP